MVFSLWFYLHFLNDSVVEHLFVCLWAICMSSLEKDLCALNQIVWGVLSLSCRSSLHILDIDPLSNT